MKETIRVEYNGYTISFSTKSELWAVDLGGETQALFTSLKEAKKAINDKEKVDKVILKPFTAIYWGDDKRKQVTVNNISSDYKRVYADGLAKDYYGKARNFFSLSSYSDTTEVYLDTPEFRKAVKEKDEADEAYRKAEIARERATSKVGKLQMSKYDIEKKLGKE